MIIERQDQEVVVPVDILNMVADSNISKGIISNDKDTKIMRAGTKIKGGIRIYLDTRYGVMRDLYGFRFGQRSHMERIQEISKQPGRPVNELLLKLAEIPLV